MGLFNNAAETERKAKLKALEDKRAAFARKLADEGFVRLQDELRNKTNELEYNFTQVLNTNVSSVSNIVKDDIAGLVEKVEIFTSTLYTNQRLVVKYFSN